MRSFFLYLSIFMGSLALSVTFQNCGDSAMKAQGSGNNNDLNVDLTPVGEDPADGEEDEDPTNPTNPGTDFNFNVNRGDTILYRQGGGLALNLATSRIFVKNHTIQESVIYENAGASLGQDLPAAYCEDSALPHCLHINNMNCMGLGCLQIDRPIRCHWQKRMPTPEVTEYFSAFSNLRFMTRSRQPGDEPMAMDCDDPYLTFFSENRNLPISLASPQCVGNGTFFASAGGGRVQTLFNLELQSVGQRGTACNRFSTYLWNSTRFVFHSESAGNVLQAQRVLRRIEYNNQTQMARVRFKLAGDNNIYCKDNVFINPPDLIAFFPDQGLNYEVVRTQAAVADVARAEITYTEAIEAGLNWQFYLNGLYAQQRGGGAVLSTAQATEIANAVERLINQARTVGQPPVVCPN